MSARAVTVEIETPETVHASVTLFLDRDSEDMDAAAAAKQWMEYIARQFAHMRPADDVRGITMNIQWRREMGREADSEEEVA